MIDFTELPKSGTKLEQLVREILLLSGFNPYWTGEGPDQGRDIHFIENLNGPLSSCDRKWLVQCKHTAHSGRCIGRTDLGTIVDDCRQISASGYLLVTTTHPSSSLLTKLNELTRGNNGLDKVICWDSVELEKRLMEPRNYSLSSIFFPKSFKQTKWRIYNRGEPNKWAAHYKDYFIILQSRVAGSHPSLEDCEQIIKRMEKVSLTKDEMLRPRCIFYDDKHDNYLVHIDYMYPQDHSPSVSNDKLLDILQDGCGLDIDEHYEGHITHWDPKFREYNSMSDHFHCDHYDFYCDYMASYEAGMMRIPFWRHRTGKVTIIG